MSPPQPKRSDPSTLRVGMLGSWQGLDPWEAQDLASVLVRNQCFEGLYHRDGDQWVADPRYLAHELRLETVGISGHPRYAVRLVEGLRFSDGSPVQPEDVAASFERVAPLRAVARVNAAGGRRVQFVCTAADVQLEPHLGQIWSVIGKRGRQGWLGTGPYAIAEEQRGTSGEVLTLVRNRYWTPRSGHPPKIERIVFHAYELDGEGKPTALREAIESGEVDFTVSLPREVARGLQGVRKVYQPGQSTAFLAFGCRRPWVDRPQVRRALAAAIDAWAVARICHDNPAAFAARGLLPPALAPAQRSAPRYDRALAPAPLGELDAGRPAKLRMLVVWGPRPYLPRPRAAAEEIAAQLGARGVEVEVEQAAGPAEFFEAVRAGQHDLILSGYIAETADPIDFLVALLSSERAPKPGAAMASTTNLGGFADAEMERRLAAARKDPSLFAGIDELLESQRPLLPLMYGASVAVHAWRVRHFELDPRGLPSFAELELG